MNLKVMVHHRIYGKIIRVNAFEITFLEFGQLILLDDLKISKLGGK